LRDEIVRSWERCARAGLRPDRFEVPYDADVDYRGRLCWAAGPVLDRVGDDLDCTGVGLLLTDQRARVLARRVADHDTAGLLDRVQLAPATDTGKSRSARTRSARRSQAAARHWWSARNISLTP
jgi:transcriptional regulator of acetoin/glycerol metabolism